MRFDPAEVAKYGVPTMNATEVAVWAALMQSGRMEQRDPSWSAKPRKPKTTYNMPERELTPVEAFDAAVDALMAERVKR